jgi:hypothetical protein
MTVAAPTKLYRWIYGLMGVIGMACVDHSRSPNGELTDNGIGLYYMVTNPFGIRGFSISILQQVIPYVLVATLIVASIGANLSLVLHWRRARGDERQLIQVVQDTVQPAFVSVWIRSLPSKERG